MVYFWAATTILWFALMTYLSHQNGEETSRTSWILAEDVHRIWARESTEKINAFLRKAVHIVVFFILTILLKKRWRKLKAIHCELCGPACCWYGVGRMKLRRLLCRDDTFHGWMWD